MTRLDCEGSFNNENKKVDFEIIKDEDENLQLDTDNIVAVIANESKPSEFGFVMLLVASEKHSEIQEGPTHPGKKYQYRGGYNRIKKAIKRNKITGLIVIEDVRDNFHCYRTEEFEGQLKGFLENHVSIPTEERSYINSKKFEKMVHEHLVKKCLPTKPFVQPPTAVGNGGVLRPS